MRARGTTAAAIGLGALLALAGPAWALEVGKYRFGLDAEVRAVRAHDVDGDGRYDLVVIAERKESDTREWIVLVLPSPAEARRSTYFDPARVVRLSLDEAPGAAAIALGRFGPAGEPRIRLLGPTRIVEHDAAGAVARVHDVPTLLGRTGRRPVVFWDAVADLDGDGRDEMWFPSGTGAGAIRVLGGDGGLRTLSLDVANQGHASPEHGLVRTAAVPKLVPADLDGDGARELVALRERTLVAWPGTGASEGEGEASGAVEPGFRLALPFLEPDPSLPPEAMRVPRIQLEDVDGDGVTDMLVTLLSGRRDRLGSLRTTLFHYPGPFRDPGDGGLVAPRARIDTESAALHPRFVDLDGDGALDYVGDSIRGGRMDLIARIMGNDPNIHYVGFRYDRERGTFAPAPLFTTVRVYPSAEALSNRFGEVAWFRGDFDGDGVADLLDLGNLEGVEILRGTPKQGDGPGDPLAFTETLMARVAVEDGLTPGAVVADLSGDGRDDAVLWGGKALYVVVPEASR